MMRVCLLLITLILVSCASSGGKKSIKRKKRVKKVVAQEEQVKAPVSSTPVVNEPIIAEPPKEVEKVVKSFACVGHDSERVVSLLHVGDNGCRVDYYKNVTKLVMAKDVEGKRLCDNTFDKVVGTLKAAGFKCRRN